MRRSAVVILMALAVTSVMAASQPSKKTTHPSKNEAAALKSRRDPKTGQKMDEHGLYTDEQKQCSEWKPTPDLDQKRCGAYQDCICIGVYCYKKTPLEVRTPAEGEWGFVPNTAGVECDDNGSGSGGPCAWNTYGRPDWYKITLDNIDDIQAYTVTSSYSMKVRLCAIARHYPSAKK